MGETRLLTVITSMGKRYYGTIDIPNSALRTTDLLNSATTYWKNQQSKVFDDAILLRDGRLLLEVNAVYREFDSIQVRLSKVVLFFDNYKTMGSEHERKRVDLVNERAGDKTAQVYALTTATAGTFYEVTGRLSGLAKQKSQQRFIPIHNARVTEIFKQSGKWSKRELILPHSFVGVNTHYVEAFEVSFV